MDEYKQELKHVKQQLREVEQQLDGLLQRQSQLLEQEAQLESVIQSQESSKRQAADTTWDKTDFPWSNQLQEELQTVFKMTELRPMQLQTMNATLSGRDCLLIMPTGGGKSLCFQLPALLSKGITVVVSPLVSLMEDQVMGLERFGVEGVMLNAAVDKNTLKWVQDAMTDPRASLRLIYVTPEKLAKSKRFMNRLEKMNQVGRFARLVIDEVHCCSQWGHDFRPDYKFLGIMKRQFPGVPILGLTATATLKVLEDVKKILNIPDCLLLRSSFNRPNLYYQVRPKPSSQEEVLQDMASLINTHFNKQSGIVYCFSQKESEEVAQGLQRKGIEAVCYHANMDPSERSRAHLLWASNQAQVVVATVAFGMGIDKPDVRFVLHHSLSKSMENLYQESGRAGRDGLKSHCILYYRFADVARQSTMVFTERTGLENLYGIVAYCIDVSGCRRSRIARHFGEVWDSTQCAGMCDHCDPKVSKGSQKRDVTRVCQDVIRILRHAASTSQRVTAPKVLDAWYGKGPLTLRLKEVKVPGILRPKAERVLAHMLLEGYIKEDFHFTAYSTICYLLPGTLANQLMSGACQVAMEFQSKTTASASSTSATIASPNANTKTQQPQVSLGSGKKVKPVIVNKQHSHFSSFPQSVAGSKGNADVPDSGTSSKDVRSEKKKLPIGKKRRPVISDDESDDESEKKRRKERAEDLAEMVDLAFDDDSDFDDSKIKRKSSVCSENNGQRGKGKNRLSLSKMNSSHSDKSWTSVENGAGSSSGAVCVVDSDSD